MAKGPDGKLMVVARKYELDHRTELPACTQTRSRPPLACGSHQFALPRRFRTHPARARSDQRPPGPATAYHHSFTPLCWICRHIGRGSLFSNLRGVGET